MYRYTGSKISDGFKNEILSYQLEVPSSNYICRKLLIFIRVGNPFFKRTKEERIQFVRELQSEWHGKKIVRNPDNKPGTVISVVPLPEYEWLDYNKRFPNKKPITYLLSVRWEGERTAKIVSPDYVTKAETSR
jgi:hypothetical protein